MPGVVKKVRGKWRIFEPDSDKLAKNGAGTPLDGGGHVSKFAAERQVRAIEARKHDKG